MLQDTIKTFEKIVTIPRCSTDTKLMMDFLTDYCRSKGYEFRVDEAGNIYAKKGVPVICLQAHYDMVCVGDAPKIDIVYEDNIIRAKNSTLGADNGMAIAIIMQLMQKYDNLEVIFTNDEEIGLWGAGRCEFKIESKRLLNLDSEDENEICIGCAGGVDIKTTKEFQYQNLTGEYCEIFVGQLPGGHSGVEISKNIPNAIKVLCKILHKTNYKIVTIGGGLRHNVIPFEAFANVLGEKGSIDMLKQNIQQLPKDLQKSISFKEFGRQNKMVIKNTQDIIGYINSFSQGVRSFNTEVGVVNDSINLAVLKIIDTCIHVDFFARSMTQDGLENTKFETCCLANSFGFDVKFHNESRPWNPVINDFSKKVLEVFKKHNQNVHMKAIHAGLECGVFVAKDEKLQACSIGPNIYFPHSVKEYVEIDSVKLIIKVLDDIINFYQY